MSLRECDVIGRAKSMARVPVIFLLVATAILIQPAPVSCQNPSIAELRQAGRYTEALTAARSLAETTRRDRHARAWEREDALRLVATLQTIVALPDSARSELAAADRVEPEIARLIVEGGYRRARELAQQQLAARLRYLGEEHQETACSRKWLADLASDQLDFDLSVGMQADVLALRRRILGETHPEVVESLRDLGYAIKNRGAFGDQAKAAATFQKALELCGEVLPPDDPAIATTLFWMADLARSQFHYDKAIEGFRKVIELRQARLGPGHPEVAMALAYLAYVLEMQEKFDEAAAPAGRAAAICRTAAGVPVVDRIFADCAYAYALAEEGRYAESEQNFTDALRIQEFMRSQALDAPLRNNGGLVYASRAQVQLLQGRTEEAWASVERGTGRRVLDAIARPDTSAARFATATGDIPDDRFLPLADVQAALPEGAAYVGWLNEGLTSPLRNLSSWGYVIRRTGPVRWFRLPVALEMTEKGIRQPVLSSLREDLWNTAGWPFRATDTTAVEQEARAAYRERFAPLVPGLDGIRTLIVVNSSVEMSLVPIEALVDSSGESVLARYDVFQVPSATCFAQMRKRNTSHRDPRSWRALAIGDPLPVTRTTPRAADTRESLSSPPVDWDTIEQLPPLPTSREEVARVGSNFRSARILVREAASADSVRKLASSGELAHFDLIHLAVHALRLGGNLRETLLLPPRASAGDREGTDALVGVREIAGWRLKADLVTVSACRSMGAGEYPEGLVGLSTAFLLSGARSVLASLWKMDDEATSLLMGRFYEDLTGAYRDKRAGAVGVPLSSPAALREAKMWLRSYRDAAGGRPFAHPAYWAGFVLLGDPLD